MSLRQIRNSRRGQGNEADEENLQEEFGEAFAQTKAGFEGLEISSQSENEVDSESIEGACALSDEIDVDDGVEKKVQKTKKKRNNHKKKNKARQNEVDNELDEIDRSVMEVNALLGAPRELAAPPALNTQEAKDDIFKITQKHLNVGNELIRMFGSEGIDEKFKKRGGKTNVTRLLKKALLVPFFEDIERFPAVGLSMTIKHREGDVTFFEFEHSKKYQNIHKLFLDNWQGEDLSRTNKILHVEFLLEKADYYYLNDDFNNGNKTLETVLAYMQFVAHPSFNLVDGKSRLKYSVMENRAFHVALLKYMYVLSNRGCHRTALELCKLQLALDPADPLGLLLVLDMLAVRAREHEWLVAAVDKLNKDRQAGVLYNMQYSCALCAYHIAVKNRMELDAADKVLREAILRFPTVATELLKCAKIVIPRLETHTLFGDSATPKSLQDLIVFYANFVISRWRERHVMSWFTRNVEAVLDQLENDEDIKTLAAKYTTERVQLYQEWPAEIVRHLCVIKAMSQLLVDGAVPEVTTKWAADPPPQPLTVDRNGYYRDSRATWRVVPPTAFYDFLLTFLPQVGAIRRDEFEAHLIRILRADPVPGENDFDFEPGFDILEQFNEFQRRNGANPANTDNDNEN